MRVMTSKWTSRRTQSRQPRRVGCDFRVKDKERSKTGNAKFNCTHPNRGGTCSPVRGRRCVKNGNNVVKKNEG